MTGPIRVGDHVLVTPDDGMAYEVLAIDGDTATITGYDDDGHAVTGGVTRPLADLTLHLTKESADALIALLDQGFNPNEYIEVDRPE